MAIAKLKNVRIIFPRMWTPNEKGKYTCGILIEKDSPAYKELMRAINEAWSVGRSRYGKDSFCENPTVAQLFNRAYIKVDGGLDSKGNPVPEYYAGCIGFTANARSQVPTIDASGAQVFEGDARVYDGQNAHVSLDIAPVKKDNNPCIGRYLRSILILGDGEHINTGKGGAFNIQSEWADEIDTDSSDMLF